MTEQKDTKGNLFFTEYIVKKVDKICNALYIITSFFLESEPLRVSIRKKTIDILSDISSLRALGDLKNVRYVARTSIHITELMALLTLARSTDLISDMNYRILEQELTALANFGDKSGGPVFEKKYFDTELLLSKVDTQKPTFDKGTNSPEKPQLRDRNPRIDGEKGSISEQKDSVKRKRSDLIINLIKEYGHVTIRDISKHFPEYSQKTIQRELIELIGRGIIRKEGDKRWTTYFLS